MELERHLSTEANDIVVIAVVPVNLDVVQPELHVGVVGVLYAQLYLTLGEAVREASLDVLDRALHLPPKG